MSRLTEPQTAGLRQERLSLPAVEPHARTGGMVSPPTPPSRLRRLRKPWLIASVLLIAAVTTLWMLQKSRKSDVGPDIRVYEVRRMDLPITLIARGEIKAKKNTEIRCQVEGRSTIVWLIDEGKQVKEGDLLVELTNEGGGGGLSIEDRIKQQEIAVANGKAALEGAKKTHEIQVDKNASDIRKGILALDMAKLTLTKFKEGDTRQYRQTAQLTREEAEAVLRRREADFETSKQLFARGYITRTEHENDKFNAYKAKLEVEKALLAEEILTKYSEKRDLAEKEWAVEEAVKELERTKKSAEAQAAQTQAALVARTAEFEIMNHNLEKLQRQKENLKIRAPGPGMVVYHRSNPWDPQRIEVGASVYERQILIDLPDPTVMQVEVKINESQMDKMDLDLPATVEVEGVPNVRFTGKITKIGVLADAQNRWINPNIKEYSNEITLDQQNEDLKPGMSATADILVKRLENVLAVPVQSVFSKGGNSYLFVSSDPVTVRQVKLGMSSTEYVQVLDGMKPSERVLLAVSDEHKRLLPHDSNNEQSKLLKSAGKRPPVPPQHPGVKPKSAPDAKAVGKPNPASKPASGGGPPPPKK